ncbi:MAG: alpha/beta hydrolase [Actinomycetota bacterium]|nr:alpha/beta hydrolase [Actinomycetota bacterium]
MTDFVLVPGAGGDSYAWRGVVAALEARGSRAVAVDLPATDEAAGILEYADAVVSAACDFDGVVLVAHSMGAYAAVVAAERLDVGALIFVAAMIPAAGETAGEWWTRSGQTIAQHALDVAEGRDPNRFDEQESFWHDVPPEVLEKFAARGPRPQAQRPFDDSWTATRWRSLPIAVVAAENDRLFPLHFMQRLSRERLGVEPVLVPTGHWPALAAPEMLAHLLFGLAQEAGGAATTSAASRSSSRASSSTSSLGHVRS